MTAVAQNASPAVSESKVSQLFLRELFIVPVAGRVCPCMRVSV